MLWEGRTRWLNLQWASWLLRRTHTRTCWRRRERSEVGGCTRITRNFRSTRQDGAVRRYGPSASRGAQPGVLRDLGDRSARADALASIGRAAVGVPAAEDKRSGVR